MDTWLFTSLAAIHLPGISCKICPLQSTNCLSPKTALVHVCLTGRLWADLKPFVNSLKNSLKAGNICTKDSVLLPRTFAHLWLRIFYIPPESTAPLAGKLWANTQLVNSGPVNYFPTFTNTELFSWIYELLATIKINQYVFYCHLTGW